MKKMPQGQRREADVAGPISSGRRSCSLRTDWLATRDGGRAARRMGHFPAEGTTAGRPGSSAGLSGPYNRMANLR